MRASASRDKDRDAPVAQPVIDAFDEAIDAIKAAGATVIDLDAAGFTFPPADGEFLVLVYEFRIDLSELFRDSQCACPWPARH